MSRRWVVGLSGAVVLALALGSTAFAGRQASSATSKSAAGLTTITVVERALTDTVVDSGPSGDSIGDSLAWANPLYNAANTKRVGRDQGSCVRTKVGVAWECSWTSFLNHGQVVVQGPFYDDGRDSMLAITGGTGAYANARGEMRLHWRNALGSEFDFVYMILH